MNIEVQTWYLMLAIKNNLNNYLNSTFNIMRYIALVCMVTPDFYYTMYMNNYWGSNMIFDVSHKGYHLSKPITLLQ